ncbi:hypothetical protein FOXB_14238, partial [Fusarium oxysporum f. sp. conglutinans Fo5176]
MQKDTNDSSGAHLFTDETSGLISEFFDLMLSNEDELQIGAALPVRLLRTMLHHEITSATKHNVRVFETLDRLEEDVYLSPAPLNGDWSDASPLNVDWSDASPLDVDWSDAMWTVF